MILSSPHPVPDARGETIAARLAQIRADVRYVSVAAAREPDDVTLVAVSKTQPPDAIDEILAAGQRVFGENRVQEAQGRWQDRRTALPDLELRLIGPLQTNKVVEALALFDVIETVDRDRLADALAKAAMRAGTAPRILVQVNTGEEPQKAGVLPAQADALIAHCRDRSLLVEGLMCIPPAREAAGPHFALLARIALRNGLDALSMGMSSDYRTAIRLGATHIRLGTALFGERNALEMPSIP